MVAKLVGVIALVTVLVALSGCGGAPEVRPGLPAGEELLPGPFESPRNRRDIIENWKLKVHPRPRSADLSTKQVLT